MKKLLTLLMIVCTPAFAWDFEAAVGVTKFDETNGIFYYENLPHDNKLVSPSFQIGVADRIYGQRFRVGYQYFGHMESNSTLYTTQDGQCHDATRASCGREQHWYGEGTAQAIYLQWEPEYKRGNWRFFADIGPMYVKARYQEKQVAWFDGYTIDGPNDYRWKWTGWSVGVEYKDVAIVFQHQPLSSSEECTFYTKADTISLRMKF